MEVGIVSVAFFALILGIITIGYLIYTYNTLGFMAQQGARWASVRGNTSGQPATSASVKTFVLTQATGLSNSLNVTTNWNPDENPGSLVTVTVTYTAAPLYTYNLSSLALTSSASATIRR